MPAAEEYMRGRAWKALMEDVSADPCKYPDLRDSLYDWLRDYQQRLGVQQMQSLRDLLGAPVQPGAGHDA